MRTFTLSLLVAAILGPLAGCVVHDRTVERDRPVYREEVRHDDRPVVVEHEHPESGIHVDVQR